MKPYDYSGCGHSNIEHIFKWRAYVGTRREPTRRACLTTRRVRRAAHRRARPTGEEAVRGRRAMSRRAKKEPTVDELLAAIAKKCLAISTLETRNSDRLDFHDVAVWSVKDALLAAYCAGLAAAKEER